MISLVLSGQLRSRVKTYKKNDSVLEMVGHGDCFEWNGKHYWTETLSVLPDLRCTFLICSSCGRAARTIPRTKERSDFR
jgi:hypothetical protein